MKNSPIAFFDSGVGLFSILSEAKKLMPYENFVIFADQANNPYGEKTKSQVIKFSKGATDFLIKKHKIKMMVLACNTATVLALDQLRRTFDIPIVGTVPAVKVAAAKTKKSKIAVMSTPATAKSRYLKDLIEKFSPNASVLRLGCRGLEEAIEVLDKKAAFNLIKKYSKSVKNFGADTVVLGCTHYPLMKLHLQDSLPGVKLIDSGKAIAKRIKSILEDQNKISAQRLQDFYYTTGDPKQFSKVSSIILKREIEAMPALA